MTEHAVVSKGEWLSARRALLAKEKALTRQRDALTLERMNLPWERIEKAYVFEGLEGSVSLADLFDGKSQLLIYHFMFGPDWEQGCHGCSLAADSMNANYVHLTSRDVAFAFVSRAPIAKIEAFRERMGWNLPWFSSFQSDFNYDFQVSFTAEELNGPNLYNFGTSDFPTEEAPGLSAFYRNESGEIFHTYSSYGR